MMGMMRSLVSIQDGKIGMVIKFGGYEGHREMRVAICMGNSCTWEIMVMSWWEMNSEMS